jgi:hypothetical protein
MGHDRGPGVCRDGGIGLRGRDRLAGAAGAFVAGSSTVQSMSDEQPLRSATVAIIAIAGGVERSAVRGPGLRADARLTA